jgi:hypothetical protein
VYANRDADATASTNSGTSTHCCADHRWIYNRDTGADSGSNGYIHQGFHWNFRMSPDPFDDDEHPGFWFARVHPARL